MRVALAQINLTVGDLDGNVARLTRVVEEAREAGAQVVAVPELAVTGYPPEDLVLKRSFVRANQEALEEVAGHTGDLLAVIGFVEAHDEVLHNSAALCTGGDIVAVYRKQLLPNYGVFDERRYFLPGLRHVLAESSAGVLGLCVCEDAWSERGPVISQGDAGAQVVVNINASPYHKGKLSERTEMLAARARRARASIVYVNMVGGQDELVFDGGSLVLDPDGELVARLPQFEERLEVVDVPLGATDSNDDPAIDRLSIQLRPARGPLPAPMVAGELRPEEEMYRALTLGVRD
ncbi:MAG: nitrilase-related carbon-nitrogen hydrolase, partial [Actinomycetota bacterium]